DLDLIICNTNAEVSVYRNNSESMNKHNFLKVSLQGTDKNTFGIGAKVILYAKDQRLHQEMVPVRGLQSSVNPELVFGLGNISRIDSLVMYLTDGKQETLSEVAANQSLRLLQENAAFKDSPDASQETYYTALNNNLGIDYKHEQTDVLDFRQDRLMPNAMSNVGPKIIQGDFNGDGLQDIYLGGSK